MDKDFWDKVNRLEELAKKALSDHQVIYEYGEERYVLTKFIAAAHPAMILKMIAELRKMWRQNNWDVAALQAYGALPKDMEVHIENESFAWHLNRIKAGLGKRLEMAEKRLDACLRENKRLEKEADWLAGELRSWEYDQALHGDNFPGIKEFREMARKAVSEYGNA